MYCLFCADCLLLERLVAVWLFIFVAMLLDLKLWVYYLLFNVFFYCVVSV